MKLLFVHGWGFDRAFWAPLCALLADCPHAIDDRGYFGAPVPFPPAAEPCLAVTHSFGTMRVLADPPPGLAGIVAINGFGRFTAAPDRAGVPPRVLDRMLRRFDEDPRAVLAEFRHSCGSEAPFDVIDAGRLREDLLRLREEEPPPPRVPVLAVQGGNDPILPPAMRAAVFAGCDVRRLEHPVAGHLLPLQDPAFCAQAVRQALA